MLGAIPVAVQKDHSFDPRHYSFPGHAQTPQASHARQGSQSWARGWKGPSSELPSQGGWGGLLHLLCSASSAFTFPLSLVADPERVLMSSGCWAEVSSVGIASSFLSPGPPGRTRGRKRDSPLADVVGCAVCSGFFMLPVNTSSESAFPVVRSPLRRLNSTN